MSWPATVKHGPDLGRGAVDAKVIEELVEGKHPALERDLVMLARGGELKGIVAKPARYSATSIQWFADCERLFYWPTLAGLESPPSESQKYGTKLHAYQERWLKHGKPPDGDDAGRLAALGLAMLPKPREAGLTVEEPFTLSREVTELPVEITGTKDYTLRPYTPTGEPDLEAKSFRLGDHKTMRSKKYFGEKTKPWLASNIQANLYAFDEWVQLYQLGYEQLRVVDKRWTYYFRENREAETLRVVDGLDHVQEQFENVIKPKVLRMAEMVSAAPRVTDVPANKSACDAYGGCPHRARCFGFGQGSETMGVLAGKFGKAAIAAKATAQPAPLKGAGAAINPPAPKPMKTAPPPPPVEEEEQQEETQTEEAAAEETQEEEQQEEAAPPAKVAKPKGATKKVAEVAAQTEKAFTKKPAKSGDLRAPGGNPEHNYWLFVGSLPTKGWTTEVVDLDAILGTAQAAAATAVGSTHYRAGDSYGVLEACFAAWMEENALTGAIHVADPKTIAARDVIGLLRAHAAVVVTGVL